MRYLLIVLLFFLWLPAVAQGLLYHTYLWQLKEYRLDRVLDFVRSSRRMALRNGLGWLAWSAASALYPAIGMLGLAGLATGAARRLERRKLPRPVFTGRAILILAGAGGLIALGLAVPVVVWQLWRALLPVGGDILTGELRALVVVFVLLRALVPLFVAAAVGAIYVPSEIQKRRVIRRAAAKVAEVRPKNIIGITGSYGKTSTKSFLATILSARYRTFATEGGTNINIAIARQILRELRPDHEQMVVEMAAYTQGEIAAICRTTPPNIGIWLAVNEQHLSLFGGIESTVRAKYELIASLPPDGVAILNGDDPRVMKKCQSWPGRKVTFSVTDPNADYNASDIVVEPEQLHFTLHTSHPAPRTSHPFSIPLPGRHNLANLLAAIAAAHEVGMSLQEIAEAAQSIRPLPGTLALVHGRKGTLLLDSSYSSNPAGVRAALDYLAIFEGKKKIMLFPGIIELGAQSDRIHRELGAEIARVCDLLILVKDEFADPLMEGVAGQTEVLRKLEDGQIFRRLEQLAGRDTVILFEGRGTGKFLEGLRLRQQP